MNTETTADPLDDTPSASKPATKRAAKKGGAKTAAKKTAAKAPATKAAAKKTATKAPATKRAPAAAGDVSTVQPEDKVVLAAVRKLKEPTLAATVAATLGVHRRVIRNQLQRLSKEKANGVVMKKNGFNWYVSSKAA
jgi:hypothetical protein